jgi:hypothetical protein
MVTKLDAETNEMILWCGGEDFDIIQAQKELNNAGMSIRNVREDKWATVSPVEIPEGKEAVDG